jgi:uncharacterized protein (DUF433 family)
MNQLYVEIIDDAYCIAGSRVSLESVVYAYWNGHSAESIAQSFPALSLEQVYGALTFYLANRAAVDADLSASRTEFESMREASRQRDPMFYQKLTDGHRAEKLARQ